MTLGLAQVATQAKDLSKNRELSQLVKHRDTEQYLLLYIYLLTMRIVHGKFMLNKS